MPRSTTSGFTLMWKERNRRTPLNIPLRMATSRFRLFPISGSRSAMCRILKWKSTTVWEQLKFGQPVLVNSEVRCRVSLKAIINLRGTTKATLFIQLEIKDQPAYAFVGDALFLYHFK